MEKTKVFNFSGATVKVRFPDITPEERGKRMNLIHKAAAELLKNKTQGAKK